MSPWHAGAAPATAPRWAAPVPLLADESMTSWLVRAALVHGCDPPTLTGWIWPRWRIWAVDADRMIPDARLAALCRTSGIAAEAFHAAAIGPIATRILGTTPNPRTAWPWILPLGARNMKRSGGVQLCPACLHGDHTPHFRLQWRFGWHTGCETHEVALLDRCPQCASPIEPHRLRADARHAATCATCLADLRACTAQPCDPAALTFQRAADRAARGRGQICFDKPAGTDAWFAVADFLAALVRRAARSPTSALDRLLDATGAVAPRTIAAEPGARIEQMRVEDRRAILAIVARMMQLTQEELRSAFARAQITRQGLCERGRRAPEPLAHLIRALPHSRAAGPKRTRKAIDGPRGRRQVTRMMDRLRRTLERQHR